MKVYNIFNYIINLLIAKSKMSHLAVMNWTPNNANLSVTKMQHFVFQK